MKPLNLAVLLFCLIAYGHSRPSDNDEHDEIIREAKRDNKHFQHDSVSELPLHQMESSTTENMLGRLKSIAHLRMAETKKPALDSITREELEALRDILDENLQKYQNYNEYSTRKRPRDPYIGQILHNLNGEPPSTGGGNNNMRQQQQHYHHNNNYNNNDGDDEQLSDHHQMPIRRKIIRHTVFATPMQGGNAGVPNRMYNGGDASSRIDWSSPWADYFPILIKDPLQTMMNSFSEIIEYGPAADICRHSTGNVAAMAGEDTNRLDGGESSRTTRRIVSGGKVSAVAPEARRRSRRNTVAARSEEEKGALLNHVRPFKHTTTTTAAPEPSKLFGWTPDKEATEHNGDTGPQIKRLVVRRGGVAIAGPGGIATAGSGGTAIVGPGGSAYSNKHTASGSSADVPVPAGGISMAGYGPQMVQGPTGYYAPYPQQNNGFGRSLRDARAGGTAYLSADGVAYTFPTPSRGLTASQRRRGEGDGREISLPDGAKLIATGPIVYYNPEPAVRKKSRKSKKSAKLVDHQF
ncbi:uncharacterized protein LOC100166780 isoform X1 [Acyrthosiphon pisum]|uniref:DUF4774 domain-containing protein n=1 Tax=Acyrthosiphon pisum TaxID=7029 RepID=A0A8R2AFG1_ACYPI|nr:uncharacterized protein LOC100166780 isoform X1 [Acyrthosiphon pisum]|eukprot:XP_003248087.1 PREDICTED: uncharacterized protein LOC100166780 isoform X1 [Acyrthosiphon pisum]